MFEKRKLRYSTGYSNKSSIILHLREVDNERRKKNSIFVV